MARIETVPTTFDVETDIVVVGAGACGLCAALAAIDEGAEVLVMERDASALGSTAMSTAQIPAAGTPEQAGAGIPDSPDRFFDDIVAKTDGQVDRDVVRRLVEESADTVAWLRDRHGAPLELITSFLYPGHSHMRMYGTPNRAGGELQAALERGLALAGGTLLTEARVDTLHVEGDAVAGVGLVRPDGSRETIGCKAAIIACCGFGGDPEMVRRWVPEMADAVYHGHPGNKGDALIWGEALGAQLCDMTAYQGHGGLAVGHGVPILWPVIVEGGFQVNALGRRFSDESLGYSEQAAKVNAQPGRVAWTIFDSRLHRLMLEFEDYRDALSAGAVIEAAGWEALAAAAGLPFAALQACAREVESHVRERRRDAFGRLFADRAPLAGPFYAAKVTGALFHTQGGLAVTPDARVKRADGSVLPNLFAGGGAARGVSGAGASGYIAGNGLMTATTLGKIAGRIAAAQVREDRTG